MTARQLGYPPNFDLNGVEIDYGSDAVLRLRLRGLQRRMRRLRRMQRRGCAGCSGQPLEVPRIPQRVGDAGRVAMLAATDDEVAEQEEAREELDELAQLHGWAELGDADRNIYLTSDFNAIAMDLGSLKLAAEMQPNRQLSAANTLDDVLKELKLTANAGTKSNDYIRAIELCKQHRLPVVLPDRRIIFYYPKRGLGLDRNYLDWPADSLPSLDEDNSDDFLVAVLHHSPWTCNRRWGRKDGEQERGW
jgi:hypothetical protein